TARLDTDDGGVVTGSGDAGRLVELRAVRVRLDVGGHADPRDASGRPRLGLLAPRIRVAERCERALERGARVDRPVDELGRRGVRQIRFREHVSTPDL